MTNLPDRALEAVQTLPAEAQDEIARIVVRLVGNDAALAAPSYYERKAIAVLKEQMARSEFAIDEQVKAVWRKCRL